MAKSTRPRTKTRVRAYFWTPGSALHVSCVNCGLLLPVDRGTSCFEEGAFRQRKGRFSNHSHKRDKDPSAAQAP